MANEVLLVWYWGLARALPPIGVSKKPVAPSVRWPADELAGVNHQPYHPLHGQTIGLIGAGQGQHAALGGAPLDSVFWRPPGKEEDTLPRQKSPKAKKRDSVSFSRHDSGVARKMKKHTAERDWDPRLPLEHWRFVSLVGVTWSGLPVARVHWADLSF